MDLFDRVSLTGLLPRSEGESCISRGAGVGDSPPAAYMVLNEDTDEGIDEIETLEADVVLRRSSPPSASGIEDPR